ncbi:Ribonuclease R, partial [human gut metagenome]
MEIKSLLRLQEKIQIQKKREGEVVEILERNTTTVVGIYEDSK